MAPRPDAERLVLIGIRNAQRILKFTPGTPRFFNFFRSPELISNPLLRIFPTLNSQSNFEGPSRDTQMQSLLDDLSQSERLAPEISPAPFGELPPDTWWGHTKIRGIIFEPLVPFRTQWGSWISRAEIRHGMLTKLTHSNWVLELACLEQRTAHDSRSSLGMVL